MPSILDLANQFKLFAQDAHDTKFRHQVINQPPIPNSYSFKDMAETVLADLNTLDPSEQDAGLKASHYALMDVLKENFETPNPNQMLNAATQAYNTISKHPKADQQQINNAKYLLALTRLIIAKYFTPHAQAEEQQSAAQEKPKPESTVSFLQRTYKTLRQGSQLSEQDRATFNNYRNLFQRRLNGLNALPTRTPNQNQEKQVIEFVLNRVK